MKRIFLAALLVVSLLLIGVGVFQLSQGNRQIALVEVATAAPVTDVPRISVEDLSAALDGAHPPLVWEFKTAETYAQGHIPGSRLVLFNDIEALARDLDRNQPIVTLCT